MCKILVLKILRDFSTQKFFHCNSSLLNPSNTRAIKKKKKKLPYYLEIDVKKIKLHIRKECFWA